MKLRIAAVALSAAALLSTAGPAAGSVATSIQIDRSGRIVGAETSIGSAQAVTVKLTLLSPPRADGTRKVWARCALPYAGPGQYRCEFDIGAATPRRRRGEWLARLRLDDDAIARKPFYLP
jgi:hypothetical protein